MRQATQTASLHAASITLNMEEGIAKTGNTPLGLNPTELYLQLHLT